MITHDVDEAIYLADRIVLMTNGPDAVLAEIVENPLPKERKRTDFHKHPLYYGVRNHIIDFLVTRSKNFADGAEGSRSTSAACRWCGRARRWRGRNAGPAPTRRSCASCRAIERCVGSEPCLSVRSRASGNPVLRCRKLGPASRTSEDRRSVKTSSGKGDDHETRRPHRKAPRHQAREGLDLETHLRADRRHVAGADHRRAARPAEADQAAGREGRQAVRPVEEPSRRCSTRCRCAAPARRCRRPIR